MIPSKRFFISTTVVFIFSISFWLLLRFPFLCLHYLFALACCPLFCFSVYLIALSTLFIVTFNSWSDNFKISDTESQSPVVMFAVPLASVFLLFSLCLWLMLLSLKDRHDVLSKKNKGKYAFRFHVVWLPGRLCLLFAVAAVPGTNLSAGVLVFISSIVFRVS